MYLIIMSLYLCSLLMIQTLYTHRISWLPLSLGGVWRGPVPVPGLGRGRGRAHVEARVAAVARRLLGAAVAVPSTGGVRLVASQWEDQYKWIQSDNMLNVEFYTNLLSGEMRRHIENIN